MRKQAVLLLVLFILTIALRLFFAFQTPHLDLDAYFAERQVENVLETGLPLYDDSLSFGGKTHVFMPLFYYVLAAFSFFFPFPLIAKILPNVFAATLIFSTYLLAKRIANKQAALFTAFISAFIPIFFSATIHSVSPLTLLLPLLVYQVYCFLTQRVKTFTVLAFILPLIHYTAFLLPLSLVVYMLIAKIENVSIKQEHKEMIVFSLAVTLWISFLFFKQALLDEGLQAFFSAVPLQVLLNQLLDLNLVRAVYLLGIIPFIYGVFSTYVFLVKKRTLQGFVIISFVITPFLLLFTTAINLSESLLFLGVFLTVVFSYHYHAIGEYVKKTRLAALKYYWRYFITSMVVGFILTAVIPSLLLAQGATAVTLSQEEADALAWVESSTPENSVVFATVEEGNAIAALGKRKTVLDNNFLLAPDASVRYKDYQQVLNTPFKTETIRILDKYEVDYLYVSERMSLRFQERFDVDCMVPIFDKGVTIYEVQCELKTE